MSKDLWNLPSKSSCQEKRGGRKTKERKERATEVKERRSQGNVYKMQGMCMCKAEVCEAIGLQQCSVCKNVLKSQCSKKTSKIDSGALVIVYLAARKDKVNRKRKRCEDDEEDEESEDEENLEDKVDNEESGEDPLFEESEKKNEDEEDNEEIDAKVKQVPRGGSILFLFLSHF